MVPLVGRQHDVLLHRPVGNVEHLVACCSAASAASCHALFLLTVSRCPGEPVATEKVEVEP